MVWSIFFYQNRNRLDLSDLIIPLCVRHLVFLLVETMKLSWAIYITLSLIELLPDLLKRMCTFARSYFKMHFIRCFFPFMITLTSSKHRQAACFEELANRWCTFKFELKVAGNISSCMFPVCKCNWCYIQLCVRCRNLFLILLYSRRMFFSFAMLPEPTVCPI